MPDHKHDTTVPSADAKPWRKLTWDDLETWAGSRSLERGRSYQRSGRVHQLSRSADGTLLAWVHGGDRYATQVTLRPAGGKGQELSSHCTCPLHTSGCKHAVAVVVAYLEALKRGDEVPLASAADPRWSLLEEDEEVSDEDWSEEDFEDEDWAEGEEEDEDEEEEAPAPARRGRKREPARSAGGGSADVRTYLEELSAAELRNLLLHQAERDPDLAKDLAERSTLARGEVGELVQRARKDIRELTRESVWYNSWRGEGNLPDYSGLRRLFEKLLEKGQSDALLDLGEMLFEGGQEQVESANDEGETATEIAGCLAVVFRAVLASGRPDKDKLLYVIDMMLKDSYDICEGVDAVLDKEWPAQVWSAVADELAGRLQALAVPKGSDFSRSYQRDSLSNWLIDCLEHAGRTAEVLPLCEAEARLTNSYDRLVRNLLHAGRLDDARRWALEGIEKTTAHWPGIAHQLQEHLRTIAERQKDWATAAAFRAEDFCQNPSVGGLKELEKAAAKADCGPEVRAAALHFLETGVRPAASQSPTPAVAKGRGRRSTVKSAAARKADGKTPSWPLPDPLAGVSRPKAGHARSGPYLDVLLDLAIAEKRPEDVLRWYDQMNKGRRPSRFGWSGGHDSARVADAVAQSHPERALAIYRQLAEDFIAQTSPSSYEAARPYLRKVREVLQRLGRGEEWTKYVARLRQEHHRKRRFLEVLDRLESRSIIEG